MTTATATSSYPPLWYDPSKNENSNRILNEPLEPLHLLMKRFSSEPDPTPLSELCLNSLVVGQEFALTCFLLARHRMAIMAEQEANYQSYSTLESIPEWKQVASVAAVSMTLLIIFIYSDDDSMSSSSSSSSSNKSSPSSLKREKILTRSTDALLLAALLRLLSAALKTLTASYSSDTVHALAIGGMLLHLVACDYNYANGGGGPSDAARQYQDPARGLFSGGTISLSAAFFSTTLLASRLSSNSTVYIFISASITIFAFYPATRHQLAKRSFNSKNNVALFITLALSFATWALLHDAQERAAFLGILVVICIVAPTWKFCLQQHKVRINGPWDIAHISIQQVDDVATPPPQEQTTSEPQQATVEKPPTQSAKPAMVIRI